MSCPQKHSLVPFNEPHSTLWMCNDCGSIGKSRRLNCPKGCNFDLCQICYDKLLDTSRLTVNLKISSQKHEHSLELGSAENKTCNFCKGTNLKFYFYCDPCEYSICETCIGISSIPIREVITYIQDKEINTHLHEHNLRKFNQSMAWECDKCLEANKSIRYRCIDKCDFDLCEICLFDKQPNKIEKEKEKPIITVPDKKTITKHDHKLFLDISTIKFCDICNLSSKANWRCQCDHSICNNCIKKKELPPTNEPILEKKIETEFPPSVFVKDQSNSLGTANCTVCTFNSANYFFVPCAHACCESCKNKNIKTCPTCRKQITYTMKLVFN